jgi:hypothetical protein
MPGDEKKGRHYQEYAADYYYGLICSHFLPAPDPVNLTIATL